MYRMKLWPAALLLSWLVVFTVSGVALANDEAAIKDAIRSYVDAFNSGDAQSIAKLWAEDAEYATPGGAVFKGRKEIQTGFETFFSNNKGVTLQTETSSIRFPSTNEAIEEGAATVTFPGQESETSGYVAVYAKNNDKWELKSVKEAEAPRPGPAFEHLKELEWMIGEWTDSADNTTIYTKCSWTKNKNFMTRTFIVSVNGSIQLEGTQVIGWDAAKKHIKSWMFDSAGGTAQGTWTKKADTWMIKTAGVLSNGARTSATNMIRYINKDSFGWRSVGREVDGAPLPAVDEVTVVRVNKKPSAPASGKE